MKTMILSLALLSGPAMATMALNPDVTQANIGATICQSGYTKTVRPPASYTNKVKRALMREAGIPWSKAADYELDHLVALTIGGAPRSLDNLRLQPIAEAKVKDKLEVKMNSRVCGQRMKLIDAQRCMYSDWRKCKL